MALEVLEAGFGATIQDLGRIGYGAMGIPEGGAMDALALQVANLLVGNKPTAAAIEIPSANFKVRSNQDCLVACTGPGWILEINGRSFPGWMAVLARAGDLIEPSTEPEAGRWGYLAFSGGVDVPVVAGSRSTFLRGRFGGLEGRGLKNGDRISSLHDPQPNLQLAGQGFPPDLLPKYGHSVTLRIIPGPQLELFGDGAYELFVKSTYRVGSRSDRMGYALEGPPLQHVLSTDILSEGVVPGVIQVSSDGNPLVLMSDAQTTGGYGKIAVVIRSDLGILAQLIPGDSVAFQPVNLGEAREEYLTLQKALIDFTATTTVD